MKVLITRIGALGDVLHALPAVAALRAAHPGWTIDWVIDPRWSPLLVNSEGQGPIVNRAHLADTKLWSRAPLSVATFRSIAALRQDLRAARYDIAVDMQGTLRSAVITRFAAAPVRAGYTDPREAQAAWFYTRKLPRHCRHVVTQGIDLLQQTFDTAIGSITRPAVSPQLPGAPSGTALSSQVGFVDAGHPAVLPGEPSADSWAAGEAPPDHRLALLSAGAGWAAKQWPASHFAELARELRAHGFDVAVTAPRKDDALANRVVAESRDAARLVVCNVAGLVALTRRAALVVGGDSGPIHLAATLGTPLVALFGPTDPARNGPWGPGPMRVLRDPASVTSYKHVPTPDPGLARISVEQVLRACREVSHDVL